jgi:hypothetical protein
MGIGDWGLGIGDWAQSPIPNPQSPIPNPQSPTDFKINGYEFIYSINYKKFEIYDNNNSLLTGFTNSITLIKHYSLNLNLSGINDYIIAGCENKLIIWKYTVSDDLYFWESFLTIDTTGGFIYNSIIFEYDKIYNIAIASFTEDYPILIYNIQGDAIKEIPYKGKSFYLQAYEKNEKESLLYLIISNWSGDISLYDYRNNLFIMNVKLKGNLKNLFISNLVMFPKDQEETLITFIDGKGRLIEMNLFSGEILRESKILYGNTPALCRLHENNSCFFPPCILLQGKKKSLEFLNLKNWESIYSIPKLHDGKLIINIWDFEIQELGEVIITYGFDKSIKILYY